MMTDILCSTCGRPNPDDQSSCDFCGSPLGADELSRLDDLVSPAEPADEISRLDDLVAPEKNQEGPTDDSSRLDDYLKSEDLPVDDSEEISIRDEIFSAEESPDQQSLRNELISEESPSEEPDRLDEIFLSDKEAEEPSPLEEIFPAEEKPQEPSPRDELLSSENGDQGPDKFFQQTEPLSIEEPLVEEVVEIPPREESPPQDDFEVPPAQEINVPPKDMQEDPGDFSSTPDEKLPDEKSAAGDQIQPSDPLNDFEHEPMSTGFGEDSGWLEMLQEPGSEDEEEPAQSSAPVPGVKKKDTDWLDKIKRLDKSADLVDEDSSFPDWLTATEKAAAAEKAKTEVPAASPGDVPDWLQMDQDDKQLGEFLRKKNLNIEESQPVIEEKLVAKVDEKDIPEPDPSDTPEETKVPPKKFPSWAGDEGGPLNDEDIPDELKFLAGIDPTVSPKKLVDPFQAEEDFFDDLYSDELPNWLETASDEGVSISSKDELTVGELPGWVEAMRPVVESTDTTGLSEDEDYIENFGPLAGIPSVLPAEAEGALDLEKAARKPLDLIATKTHQDYVSVLRKLISAESKAKEITKPAPIQTQRVLRWLISIILLITTAGTVIFGGNFISQLPEDGHIQDTGYWALYNQIIKLDPGQPVLIAFDYQPAALGELHTASASVVDHLMKQGAYLSFVSTQPTGPALAEHFLITTQEKHDYKHNQQYINLGYLPGESAGLVSFLIAPKQIIPLAFDGSNAWGSPPLVNVNSIEDFEMILVITDDPNTAKIWIEQLAPNLEDTPITMVVSAQAEPLIQPYFRSSPQYLSGYVSGIIDSMNYESLLGAPNLATKSWIPFNSGIIVTVSTIFIGGLANGFLSLFSRHRSRKTGDKK